MSTSQEATSSQTKERLLSKAFVLASLSHFFHALAFNLYLHLSGFLKTAGADEREIGIIFGATGAAAIIARPPMGRLIDQRGRVVVIRLGGFLHVIGCALYLSVSGPGAWVTGVRIMHGISEAMLFTSLFAFASDIVPASRRFEGIALFGVSGMLPISLGSLLGDFLLARAGGISVGAYQSLFIASVVLASVAFLLSLPLKEPVRKEAEEPARGMGQAFLQKNLLPLWFAGVVFATCLAAPFTFFAPFVMAEHVGTAGMFFSCYSIAAITLRILAGKVPERVGPKRVLLPAMIAVGGGLFLLSRATLPIHVAVAGTLSGLGHGYTFPILLGLVVSRARPAERGAALAIFTALFDAGSFVGNPLFGTVIDSTKSFRTMFVTAAIIMVVGTSLFAMLDWKTARTTPAS
ncbi:MAG: MFS transporter [Polyangiaceae bacterium]|nr:MFS transporter [Polyangiaceae bacterium]